MITKQGKKYVVRSQSGKKMSKPLSKKAARKRLGQIEYFKSHK